MKKYGAIMAIWVKCFLEVIYFKVLIEHHWACLLRRVWVEGFKFDCFTLSSWMSVALSFSTEKGYNFFEQVKQYHTGLLLINKLYDGC